MVFVGYKYTLFLDACKYRFSLILSDNLILLYLKIIISENKSFYFMIEHNYINFKNKKRLVFINFTSGFRAKIALFLKLCLNCSSKKSLLLIFLLTVYSI